MKKKRLISNSIGKKMCFAIGFISCSLFAQSPTKLWYDKPAEHFEETLVLGNGKMGASVFGGVANDKIYLNDATLWSGEPVNPNMNPEAYKNLPEIRKALENENYAMADDLNKKLQGAYSQSFAPLGTLQIRHKNADNPQNYYRELDLEQAVSKIKYQINDVIFTREYFISNPDQIMVIKIKANKPKALNFETSFASLLKFQTAKQNNSFVATGYAPIHAEPSYNHSDNPVIFDEKKGTRFAAIIQIKTDGIHSITNDAYAVSNATEAVIYLSIATSFNGFDKNPATEGKDYLNDAKKQIQNAFALPFDLIKKRHLTDYQSFFQRVKLNLGKSTAPDLPTNERLLRYAEGKEDKNLEILYFNFGRYLLISSSRTLGVPANLQGIWNPYMRPPWSSNYTTNINAEENYWLAENTNLSEMHLPLMQFIENLSKTGAVTAKTFYGIQNGWCLAHNSDIWAMTQPVGGFGGGDPNWACWNMGGTWMSTHLWEHFIFTKDLDFLKSKGYPIMKGAAEFCLDWLVTDKKGNLITSPSTSPENYFRTDKGYVGATMYGGTADLAMIRECFNNTIKAANVLKIDAEFVQKLQSALDKLYPYQIGKNGNLQEWYHDWEDPEPQHRHQTHLFGLYPGHQINPEKTPELANACKKTLEIKGDETTGWSKGWRINLWARLWDGNHAYKMYRELLKYVDPDGAKKVDMRRGGGTYPNLFDAHPPFQIDGNFGGAAAVAEMLLQSDDQANIRLLPALPDAWDNGDVSGLKARGGITVSIKWDRNQLVSATFTGLEKSKVNIIYKGKSYPLTIFKNQKVSFKP